MNQSKAVKVFAAFNFLFFAISSLALLIMFLGLIKREEVLDIISYNSLVQAFQVSLLCFILFPITGFALIKKKKWGYYFHIITSVLIAFSIIGIIYTIFSFLLSFKTNFKFQFLTSDTELDSSRKNLTPLLIILGASLILFGLNSLSTQIIKFLFGIHELHLVDFIFSIPLIFIGFLLFKISERPYRGGWATVIGILLLYLGVFILASELDAIIFNTRESNDPITMGSIAIICIISGFIQIRSGHRRHKKLNYSDNTHPSQSTTEAQSDNNIDATPTSPKRRVTKTLTVVLSIIQLIIGFNLSLLIIRVADSDNFISSGLILFLLMLLSGILGIIVTSKSRRFSFFLYINAFILFYLLFDTIASIVNIGFYPQMSSFQESPVMSSIIFIISLLNIFLCRGVKMIYGVKI